MNLDVGSGHLITQTARGDVNVDIRKPEKKPQNFVQADGHHLPFKESIFDKVFLFDVIEHVENPTKLMRETFRVLKNHGKTMLTTPNPWHWRRIFRAIRKKRIVLSDTAHISAYTPVEIENLLINVGFKSIIVDFVTLQYVRIHGRHPRIDAMGERLLPKAISMANLLVMAEKHV